MMLRTSPWRAAVAAVLTAASGAVSSPLPPSARRAHGQAQAGFYRMMLGDFEITAVSDGTVDLPMDKLLTNIKPGELDKG